MHGTYGPKIVSNLHLLDRFRDASAAYSLRRLRTDYKGPCIEVSTSSGSASKDIYFVRRDTYGLYDYLDCNAILNFRISQGAELVVSTWYDQSGNGYNLTQPSAANRPGITSSVIATPRSPLPSISASKSVNGFIGISYPNDGSKRLYNSSLSVANPTFFITHSLSFTTGQNASVLLDSYDNVPCLLYYSGTTDSPNNSWCISGGSGYYVPSYIANTNLNLMSGAFGVNNNLCVNGYPIANGNPGSATLTGISVGNIRGNPTVLSTAYEFYGQINEVIIYPNGVINNRQMIEKEIMNTYKILS